MPLHTLVLRQLFMLKYFKPVSALSSDILRHLSPLQFLVLLNHQTLFRFSSRQLARDNVDA